VASIPVRFSIPEGELPGIRQLAQVPLDVLERVSAAASEEKPRLDKEALIGAIARRAGLDSDVVRSVVNVLWRLAFVQRRRELGIEAFLEALNETFRQLPPQQWSSTDAQNWSERQERIRKLLAPDLAIAMSAKATELLVEQGLVFCRARILTDVRPVFDEGAQEVQALVPFHTLAITCHEADEMREIHIALDFKDIGRMRGLLERAERKERVLRQRLVAGGLIVVDTGSESDA